MLYAGDESGSLFLGLVSGLQIQAGQNQRVRLGTLGGASPSIPARLRSGTNSCVLSAGQPQQDLNFQETSEQKSV